MGFCYGIEKRRFEREWDKLQKEYVEAGMTDEAIRSMYQFDWEVFCSRRTYENRIQPLPTACIGDDETTRSSLFLKFPNLTVVFDEADFFERYAWVDTIENQQLALALRQLSDEDLELLTFLVIEGHTQQELARKWGWTQKAVSRRFLKIKRFLKNWR